MSETSETTLTVESTTAGASSCCGSCSTGGDATPEDASALTSAFQVKGMTCGHCVTSVTAELKKVEGVTDVAVDLASGRVTVRSTRPLADADVAAAVDEAGYDLVGRLDG
ncbi:heavy-metal-associated domain-containing protein [Kitasatospora sp. NPDC101447]|uniref:heavy-metal-associated domain-containing protein n=1 Tax=Kitasatospora sp. NPDC101447 TaxID=3364102 RepID=UPI00382A5134